MQWVIDTLTGIYDRLVSTLKGWFQSIVDGFQWIVKAVSDLIHTVVNWLVDLVWSFCSFLYNLFLGEEGCVWYVFDVTIWVGEQFLESFPDVASILEQYSAAFIFVMNLISSLDLFLPVTESLYLFGLYVVFWSVLVIVRVIFKVVPGLGG